MKIRKLKKEEHNRIISLSIKSYKEFIIPSFKGKAKKFSDKEVRDRFRKKLENEKSIFYVATDKNKIIGFVGGEIKGKIAWLRSLVVDKKHHNKGIGRKLMNRIEKDFKRYKKVNVCASKYAIPFYEKIGYKKTRGIVKNKLGVVFQPMRKILRS